MLATAFSGSVAPGCAFGTLLQLRNHLSVLSWGRNVEQQCGIEGPDACLVPRPTVVLDLLQQPVQSIVAGRLNSGAVVGDGEAYMFGSGAAGCLGLGCADNAASPSRLESFVGRAAIRGIAPGAHHTLFLDADGQAWACGENKEGQCGLGTPLEVLAHQHRRAFFSDSLRPAASLSALVPPSPDRFAAFLRSAAASAGQATHTAQGWGHLGSQPTSRARLAAAHQGSGGGSSSWGRRLGPPGPSGSSAAGGSGGWGWAGGGEAAWGGSGGGSGSDMSSLGLWSSAMEAHMHASGAAPGQLLTPVQIRVGGSSSSSSLGEEAAGPVLMGCGEAVVSVAASKYYSLVATAAGEVWTFGADYNGALGSPSSSWQSSPGRVAPPIAAAIAAAGGATQVAAGGTFSAALTASGRVLVWGKLAGGSAAGPGLAAAAGPASAAAAAAAPASSGADADAAGDVTCGSLFADVGLPQGVAVTSISAGQQHLLLSDGERVWAVGRWFDAAGEEAGAAPCQAPQQVLALPGSAGVARVAAGMHSSAVVTADGRLWLWGRLLDEQHGAGIMRRFAVDRRAGPAVDWGWSGFGGASPRLVDGLESVRDVALGGWHALVLVD